MYSSRSSFAFGWGDVVRQCRVLMVGRATSSMQDRGAVFCSLSSRIPRQSDVAHDSRICGLMESQKMQKWVGYDLGTDLC